MPPCIDLSERQKLACLHQILAGIGFNENMAGHVTCVADGGRRPLGHSVGKVVGRGAGV